MTSPGDHEFAYGLLQSRQESLINAVEAFKEGLSELENAEQVDFVLLETNRREFFKEASETLEMVLEYANRHGGLEKTLEEGLSVITQQRRCLEKLLGKGVALVASSKDLVGSGLPELPLKQYKAFEEKLTQVKSHLRKLALHAKADVKKCRDASGAESLARITVDWGVCYVKEGDPEEPEETLEHIPLSIVLALDSIAESSQLSEEQACEVSRSIYGFLNSAGRLYKSFERQAQGSAVQDHLWKVCAAVKTLSEYPDDAELLKENTEKEKTAFSLVMSQLASAMDSSFSDLFSAEK